ALLDLNGDGLADLVRNHRIYGGELFLNTGTGWTELNGNATWQTSPGTSPVPVVPGNVYIGFDFNGDGVQDTGGDGAVFVDLDGDGLTDVLQETRAGTPSRAWLNIARPPIITTFPVTEDASKTVHYEVVTTDEAQTGSSPTYTETHLLDDSVRYAALPLRVVS